MAQVTKRLGEVERREEERSRAVADADAALANPELLDKIDAIIEKKVALLLSKRE
jgi:hypothetical protein